MKDEPLALSGNPKVYQGKVRDVYSFGDKVAIVASNRISAFDVILPRPIPFKGQVLNELAAHFLTATAEIVPNWLEKVVHPYVSVGQLCEPFKVEMVVRGYLAGHAWREYSAGKRTVCGVSLPDGLNESDKLPNPIITPTTKADEGHDEDISREEILRQGIVSEADYKQLEEYTLALFERGTKMAADRGLILVDTKYEFGKDSRGNILLIDEVHTPDSSRYFIADGYHERQTSGERQKQLSKEFVREWLMEHGFQGKEGQEIPAMTDEFLEMVSKRYQALFEQVTGKSFVPYKTEDLRGEMKAAIEEYIG